MARGLTGRSSAGSCVAATWRTRIVWVAGGLVKQGAGIDRLALAGLGGGKPPADLLCVVDERIDRCQLPTSDAAQDVADGHVAVLDEGPDLVKGHSGVLRDIDDRQATQDSVVVSPLAADPFGCRQKPDPLVVADSRGRHTRPFSDFPDSHRGPVTQKAGVKLTAVWLRRRQP